MMLRSFRDAWSAKLREPGLPQTAGAMHRATPSINGLPVGMCCIGVRCELDVDAGILRRVYNRSGSTGLLSGYAAVQPLPPREGSLFGISYGIPGVDIQRRWGVLDWVPPLDLVPREAFGVYPNNVVPTLMDVLMALNDSLKWTFPEIADWLDKLPVREG